MFAILSLQLTPLMAAFSRKRTFFWFSIFVLGLTISSDFLGGISPVIRALGLGDLAWHGIRRMLGSSAIDQGALSRIWFSVLKRMFATNLVTIDGRIVIVADGMKNPKEGRRMPAVKKMHQESSNNSKPEFIRGHYFETLGLMVRGAGTYFCLLFYGKIHEGFQLTNDDTRTLKDKFTDLVLALPMLMGCLMIADAWYAAKNIIGRIPATWNMAIVTRVAKNAVANLIAPPDFTRDHTRGRKRKYGDKIILRDLFETSVKQTITQTNIFGNLTEISYWRVELLWRPLGKLVTFVGCNHPEKGRIILLATDITMSSTDIIHGYTLRSRIESAFKIAIHTIGTFSYRMWSKSIERLPRWPKKDELWQRTGEYASAYLVSGAKAPETILSVAKDLVRSST